MPVNNNVVQQPIKKESHRASITGTVLAITSLVLAAIGSLLIHADYRGKATTTAEKIDNAVAGGTLHVFSVIIGVPFLIGGIVLGGLAILLIVLRLRKTKAVGLVLSVLWVLVSVWAIKISIAAFSVIKAHS